MGTLGSTPAPHPQWGGGWREEGKGGGPKKKKKVVFYWGGGGGGGDGESLEVKATLRDLGLFWFSKDLYSVFWKRQNYSYGE